MGPVPDPKRDQERLFRIFNTPRVTISSCNIKPGLRLKSFRINWLQFALGFLFLLAGSLEYLFNRQPGSAYFLNPIRTIVLSVHATINPYGPLGFLAPDFFHPLAFALMSMALLPGTLKARTMICLAWLGVDAAMELAQNYGAALAEYLPRWIKKVPVIENLDNYLVYGTFDVCDLIAIAAGILTAFGIGQLTKGGISEAATT
jgi:hypothetical protein